MRVVAIGVLLPLTMMLRKDDHHCDLKISMIIGFCMMKFEISKEHDRRAIRKAQIKMVQNDPLT
jgi:hypothetical protein